MVDYSKHIQKAEEATRRRNYDFAIELYQQLLEIEPDQGDARAGLRRALKLRAEQKKGGKLFAKIGGAGPLAAAKTMVKAKRWDSAIKSLEKFLAGNPLDVSANLLLGECCENAEHFHSACAVYEFIAEIAPKNSEGLRRAGAMMYRTGDHVRALEFYERALEIDPRDQDAIKARKDLAAETALSQGRYEPVGHSREQIKDKEEAASLLELPNASFDLAEPSHETAQGTTGFFFRRTSAHALMRSVSAGSFSGSFSEIGRAHV